MRQDEISPSPGSAKNRKRVGRGNGSGHGTFSGRGIKGQKSRSGCAIRVGFEGGQNPIIKRLTRKRGFFNHFRIEYSVVNVGQLCVFKADTEVTPEVLLEAGLIKNMNNPVKILSDGDVNGVITVKANKFSGAAKAKIEAAGGKAVEIEH
jgi:large subunit ribosomal protein L15